MQAGVRARDVRLHNVVKLHVYFAHRRVACCVQGSVTVSADANGTDDISAAAHARALEVRLHFLSKQKSKLFLLTRP